MDYEAIRAELDQDFAWRLDEIRFLQNQSSELDEAEKRRYRRALVLILYSHFEGYCKFALQHNARILNAAGIRCRDATYALAAATLGMAFQALRDTQKKNPLYGRQLPDDPALHRFARESEFLERIENFGNGPLQIPDEAVDTESNLKPAVLKAALYRLGLDPDQFEDIYSDVGKLVGLRNNIAHGATKQGLDDKAYSDYEAAALRIMGKITDDIMDALRNEAYLKTG